MSADIPLMSKEKKLKFAFWRVKEELNEHLDSINQNTGEIQEAFEVMQRLEEKLDRIEARLEKMELQKDSKNLIMLTPREEEVFALLCVVDRKLSLREIGNTLMLPEEIVNTAIFNLLAKGIPVLKQMTDTSVLIYLDHTFKDQQRKKPTVNISERILASLIEEK